MASEVLVVVDVAVNARYCCEGRLMAALAMKRRSFYDGVSEK